MFRENISSKSALWWERDDFLNLLALVIWYLSRNENQAHIHAPG